MFNSLNKENIVADKNFNRWLVPPAALLIHLSIGMIYGFSVFWKRLTQVVGTECGVDVSFFERIFITSCDWRMSDLGWTFSLAIVFLGASAAIFGHWLERAGPRKAGVAAALTWGRFNNLIYRSLFSSTLDYLVGNRCNRRNWSGFRLHFTCVDID